MKGIIIYETPLWGDEESVVFMEELNKVSYTLKQVSDDITCCLEGIAAKDTLTKVRCNKEDTYDFEIGALIALMKMCGFDKSYKAIEEAFKYNSYDAKKSKVYEEKIHTLEKEKERIIVAKNILYNNLEKENEKLIEENKTLKEKFYKKVSDLRDQIHENSRLIQTNGELRDDVKRLEEEKKHLEDKYERCQHILDARIKDKYRLEEENESLNYKYNLVKAGHDYWKSRCVLLNSRQNGKQHTLLVDLFKKIDQKKVDAAYKEVYNTTLPLWQKEVLNQRYGIYKESKEKIELPRTLDINGTVYRKSIQIKDFGEEISKLTVDSLIEQNRAFTRKCVDERLYKIPTKREEMWAEIFALHKESDVIIKVKKEDINTFLHELENKIPEITWLSTVKIFETKYTIGDIYEELKTCDAIYFRLHKRNKLSYTSDSHIYPYRELKPIDYLPPMRWDLFKKGRRIIRVTPDNLDEFMTKCSKELGGIMRPNLKRYKEFPTTFVMISDYHYDNKPTIHIMTPEDLVRNQHENPKKYSDKKIVDWEDVR